MAIKGVAPYFYMGNQLNQAYDYYKSLGFVPIREFRYDEEDAKELGVKANDLSYVVFKMSNMMFSASSSEGDPSGATVVLFENNREDKETFKSLYAKLAEKGKVMHNIPAELDYGVHACLDDVFGISWILAIPAA
jgi:uncharacterized glyoxalase superfamily protein PhnB